MKLHFIQAVLYHTFRNGRAFRKRISSGISATPEERKAVLATSETDKFC
jgi:hypothetical protein